jgi:hypothetical protein
MISHFRVKSAQDPLVESWFTYQHLAFNPELIVVDSDLVIRHKRLVHATQSLQERDQYETGGDPRHISSESALIPDENTRASASNQPLAPWTNGTYATPNSALEETMDASVNVKQLDPTADALLMKEFTSQSHATGAK